MSYAENSSMNLSCYAYAVPQVNLTWIFKDKNKRIQSIENSISANEKISIYCSDIHQGENLVISSVDSSNSGLYECIASNQYHAAISRAFYVTVQCKSKQNPMKMTLNFDII